MILGSLFVALGSILNAILVNNYLTPPQVTFVTMAGQTFTFLAILIYKRKFIEKVKHIILKAKYLIITAAAIETYAFVGINQAFKLGVASASTAVYLGMTIFTIITGIFYLKEKEHIVRKIVSSIIVIIGIIIVKVFT